MKSGIPIVISAPSGCGKTSIIKDLMRRARGKMIYSISATTREPRKGERKGKDYYFLTETQFQERIRRKKFLEWAKVFGRYYGTPKDKLTNALRRGRDVVLDIDVQGALQLKKTLKQAVFIFIIPPSLKELKRRLLKRGTDTKSEIEKRLREAKKEMSQMKHYDYFVVSDQVNQSVKTIQAIIQAEKQRIDRK